MDTTGPTIPVKKSDGTIQHMTIAEFKEYQAQILVSRSNTIAPKPAPVSSPVPVVPPTIASKPPVRSAPPRVPAMPAVLTENHLAVAAPVKDFFVDKAMSTAPVVQGKKPEPPTPKAWTAADHDSLLQESLSTTVTPQDFVSPWEQEAEKIVQKLADHVPDSLHPRLHSLIVSYQKGVRTKEQMIEYLERPLTEGGLELDEDTISTVFGAVEAHVPKKIPTKNPPVVDQEKKLATQPQTSPFVFSPDGQMMTSRPPVAKPVLHDVVNAPTGSRQAVGPAEEMQFFTLAEWRRIPGTVTDRVARLQEKFETLKKDSFLLFLEARAGWYQSSLYREYQQLFLTALQSGVSIESRLRELGDKQSFTSEELNGIIEINRYLAF